MTTNKQHRAAIVSRAYADLIRWAKSVELVSTECSENINDYHAASSGDWDHVGTNPTLAALAGEHRGLTA